MPLSGLGRQRQHCSTQQEPGGLCSQAGILLFLPDVLILFYVYRCLPGCVPCLYSARGVPRAPDALELELQMVTNCLVGAGTAACILWKSSQCLICWAVASAPMREFLKYWFLNLASVYTGGGSVWDWRALCVCVFLENGVVGPQDSYCVRS